jgi:hypothetical protein
VNVDISAQSLGPNLLKLSFQGWERRKVEEKMQESPITWNTISRRKFIKEHEEFCLGRLGFSVKDFCVVKNEGWLEIYSYSKL